MKIALITDTHWGVRNDNVAFMDNSKRFLDEIFFPYLDYNNIRTVVHLGDLVDRRKYLNHYTMHRLMNDFLIPMHDRDITCHFIAGNHDTYFKNTNEINAIENIIGDRFENNFTSYQRYPREFDFDGTKVLMLPWICDENRIACMDKIKTTSSQIVMGHLELAGFEMHKGSMVSHGDDRSCFDRFDLVLSGHYHHRSGDGTIHYLGSHAEFTWSDYNDPKGFHILDTETRNLTFIENPYKMFKKVWYNDADATFLNTEIDYAQYKNCMLKVIIQEKNNLFWFDKFIENIESENPLDIQIVEDHLNLNLEEDSDIVNEAESTIDIFKKYISGFDEKTVNKEKLEKKIVELYNEALAIE
jgi:DNA repair exonuclease SbcCD nuclease subunit